MTDFQYTVFHQGCTLTFTQAVHSIFHPGCTLCLSQRLYTLTFNKAVHCVFHPGCTLCLSPWLYTLSIAVHLLLYLPICITAYLFLTCLWFSSFQCSFYMIVPSSVVFMCVLSLNWPKNFNCLFLISFRSSFMLPASLAPPYLFAYIKYFLFFYVSTFPLTQFDFLIAYSFPLLCNTVVLNTYNIWQFSWLATYINSANNCVLWKYISTHISFI